MNWGAVAVRLFIDKDTVATTLTASAFALIDADACYTGVHTQDESVCQNCPLGRCALYVC